MPKSDFIEEPRSECQSLLCMVKERRTAPAMISVEVARAGPVIIDIITANMLTSVAHASSTSSDHSSTAMRVGKGLHERLSTRLWL